MTAQITPNQAFSFLHRHIHLVGWIAFAVFNNFLVTIALFLFWVFGLDSNTLYKNIQQLSQNLHLARLWQVLSFWGLSGAVILSLYALLWRKIYIKFSLKYLYKNIEKYKIT